mmetsp:Transcript_36103/g.84521  ORF Transcript_36103/g.84521 Transcript_36103/m.84521 type:complete len:209 (+) Transcript_36103:424-1050(+)
MFLYLCDFDTVLKAHGNHATIQWISKVYVLLDRCVTSWDGVEGAHRGDDEHRHYTVMKNQRVALSSADMVAACAAHMVAELEAIPRPDGRPTEVQVGLNTGPVCAEVIGLASPRFSIFGDTVNTASRLASNAKRCIPGNETNVHLSESTANALTVDGLSMLSTEASLEFRGGLEPTHVKGKGAMHHAYLHRRWGEGCSERSLGTLPQH